jgi:tetratricopeptide (TPR) repeat protein
MTRLEPEHTEAADAGSTGGFPVEPKLLEVLRAGGLSSIESTRFFRLGPQALGLECLALGEAAPLLAIFRTESDGGGRIVLDFEACWQLGLVAELEGPVGEVLRSWSPRLHESAFDGTDADASPWPWTNEDPVATGSSCAPLARMLDSFREARLHGGSEAQASALLALARAVETAEPKLAGLILGQAAQLASDPEKKMALLGEAVALRPDEPRLLKRLYEVASELGKAYAAARAARRWAYVGRTPDERAQAHMSAAEALAQQPGQERAAEKAFETALAENPGLLDARLGLAALLRRTGQSGRVSALLEDALAMAKQQGDLAHRARICALLGDIAEDPKEKSTWYQAGLDADAGSTENLVRLSQVLQASGRAGEALEVLQQRLAVTSPDATAVLTHDSALYMEAGRAAELLGQDATAAGYFEIALQTSRDSSTLLMSLETLYRRLGRPVDEARVVHDRALHALQENRLEEGVRLFRSEAELLYAVGEDPRPALDGIRRGAETWPNQPVLFDAWISVAEIAGDFDAVLEGFRRRLRLNDPAEVRAALLHSFGRRLLVRGQKREAAQAFEEALTLDPANAAAVEQLYSLYRESGDLGRLISVCAHASEHLKDKAGRRHFLREHVKALTDLGRVREAHEVLERSANMLDENGELNLLRLASAANAGADDLVESLAKELLARLPRELRAERGEIWTRLIDVREAQGDRKTLLEAFGAAFQELDIREESAHKLTERYVTILREGELWNELADIQRRRGKAGNLSPDHSAICLLEAARLSSRNGNMKQGLQDAWQSVQRVLRSNHPDQQLLLNALSLAEDCARRTKDYRLLAESLSLQAGQKDSPRERLLLKTQELSAMEKFADDLSCARLFAEILGLSEGDTNVLRYVDRIQVEQADVLAICVDACEVAAEACVARAKFSTAVAHFDKASGLCRRGNDLESCRRIDRRLLGVASNASISSASVVAAIERLEHWAIDAADQGMLVEILEAKACFASGGARARLLFEKAAVCAEGLEDHAQAIDALVRARQLVEDPDSDIARKIDHHLVAALERVGDHRERARILRDRGEHSTTLELSAVWYRRAAEIFFRELGDFASAKDCIHRAMERNPADLEARDLHLLIVRRTEQRAEVIREVMREAERTRDAQRASALWMEAAGLICPPGAGDEVSGENGVADALSCARRAEAATPESNAPLRFALPYVRALNDQEEERRLLLRIIENSDEAWEIVGGHLGMAFLEARHPATAAAAHRHLMAVLDRVESFTEDDWLCVRNMLPRDRVWPNSDGWVSFILRFAIELAEKAGDGYARTDALRRLATRTQDPVERATLFWQAGVAFRDQLDDPKRAEREFRAALLSYPEHPEAQKELASLLLATGRLDELVEVAGANFAARLFAERRQPEWPRDVLIALAQRTLAHSAESKEGYEEVQSFVLDELSDDEAPELLDACLQQILTLDAHPLHARALERSEQFLEHAERPALKLIRLEAHLRHAAGTSHEGRYLLDLAKLKSGPEAEALLRRALEADANLTPAREALADRLFERAEYAGLAEELGSESLFRQLFLHPEFMARPEMSGILRVLVAHSDDPGHEERLWSLTRRSDLPRAVYEELLLVLLDGGTERWPEAVTQLALYRSASKDDGGLLEAYERWRSLAKTIQATEAMHRHAVGLLGERLAGSNRTENPVLFADYEARLRALLQLNPSDDDIRARWFQILADEQRVDEIRDDFGKDGLRKAFEYTGPGKDAPFERAVLTALAKATEGAESAACWMAIADDPTSTDPERIGCWRLALEADARCEVARDCLRSAWMQSGEYTQIVEHLGGEVLEQTLLANGIEAGDVSGLSARRALLDWYARERPSEPRRATWSAEVGVSLVKLGRPEEAQPFFEKALELGLDEASVREPVTAYFVNHGDLEALGRKSLALLTRVAALLDSAGHFERAGRAYQVLSEARTGRDRAQDLVHAAEADQHLENWAQAERRLADALVADPAFEEAQDAMARLLWRTGRDADLVEQPVLEPVLRILRTDGAGDAPRALGIIERIRTKVDGPLLAEALEVAGALAQPASVSKSAEYLEAAVAEWQKCESSQRVRTLERRLCDLYRETRDRESLWGVLERLRKDSDVQTRIVARLEWAEVGRERNHSESEIVAAAWASFQEAQESSTKTRAAQFLRDGSVDSQQTNAILEHLRLHAGGNTDPTLLLALARVRDQLGAPESEVIQLFESVIASSDGDRRALEAHSALAEIYERTGRWREASQHAWVVAEREDVPELWLNLAELRRWLGETTAAGEAYRRAIRLAPGNSEAWSGLVQLAEHAHDLLAQVNTLRAWAEASDQDPWLTRAERLLEAAELLTEAEHVPELIKTVQRALDLVPGSSPYGKDIALRALALFERRGLLDDGVVVLQPILPRLGSEDSLLLRERLAKILHRIERHDEGFRLMASALAGHTGDANRAARGLIESLNKYARDLLEAYLWTVVRRIRPGPARGLCLLAIGKQSCAEEAWGRAAEALECILDEPESGASIQDEVHRLHVQVAEHLGQPARYFRAILAHAEQAADPTERAGAWRKAISVAEEALSDTDAMEVVLRRWCANDGFAVQPRRLLVELYRNSQNWLPLYDLLEDLALLLVGEERAALRDEQLDIASSVLRDVRQADRSSVRAYRTQPTMARARAAIRWAEGRTVAEVVRDAAQAMRVSEEALVELVGGAVCRLEALGMEVRADDLVQQSLPDDVKHCSASMLRLKAAIRRQDWRYAADLLSELPTNLTISGFQAISLGRAIVRNLSGAAGDADRLLRATFAFMVRVVTRFSEPRLLIQRDVSVLCSELAELAHARGLKELAAESLRLGIQWTTESGTLLSAMARLARFELNAGQIDTAMHTACEAHAALANSSELRLLERVDLLTSLAAVAFESDRFQDACSWYEEAVHRVEENGLEKPELLYALARAKQCAGHREEASEWLGRFAKRAPKLAAHKGCDETLASLGDSPALAERFNELADTAESSTEACRWYRQACDVYRRLGHVRLAARAYLSAYTREPGHDLATAVQDFLSDHELWDLLSDFLGKRLRDEPHQTSKRAQLLVSRAQVLGRWLGDPRGALELLLQARDLMPVEPEILEDLLAFASEIDDIDLAKEAVARLIPLVEIPQKKAALLARLATVYRRQGKYEDELDCLFRATEIALEDANDPGDYADRLSQALEFRGELGRQGEIWARVARASRGPKRALALVKLFELRWAERDQRGALVALSQAVASDPEDFLIRGRLLETLRQARRFLEALEVAKEGYAIAEALGRPSAAVRFLLEGVRAGSELGRSELELDAWKLVLARFRPRWILDEFVIRGRKSADTGAFRAALEQLKRSLEPGSHRDEVAFAVSRLENESAAGDDSVASEWIHADDFVRSIGASHIAQRERMLRDGQRLELLRLEQERARSIASGLERSEVMTRLASDVAGTFTDLQGKEREEVKQLLREAKLANPLNVEAYRGLLLLFEASDGTAELRRLIGTLSELAGFSDVLNSHAAWIAERCREQGLTLAAELYPSLARTMHARAHGLEVERDPLAWQLAQPLTDPSHLGSNDLALRATLVERARGAERAARKDGRVRWFGTVEQAVDAVGAEIFTEDLIGALQEESDLPPALLDRMETAVSRHFRKEVDLLLLIHRQATRQGFGTRATRVAERLERHAARDERVVPWLESSLFEVGNGAEWLDVVERHGRFEHWMSNAAAAPAMVRALVARGNLGDAFRCFDSCGVKNWNDFLTILRSNLLGTEEASPVALVGGALALIGSAEERVFSEPDLLRAWMEMARGCPLNDAVMMRMASLNHPDVAKAYETLVYERVALGVTDPETLCAEARFRGPSVGIGLTKFPRCGAIPTPLPWVEASERLGNVTTILSAWERELANFRFDQVLPESAKLVAAIDDPRALEVLRMTDGILGCAVPVYVDRTGLVGVTVREGQQGVPYIVLDSGWLDAASGTQLLFALVRFGWMWRTGVLAWCFTLRPGQDQDALFRAAWDEHRSLFLDNLGMQRLRSDLEIWVDRADRLALLACGDLAATTQVPVWNDRLVRMDDGTTALASVPNAAACVDREDLLRFVRSPEFHEWRRLLGEASDVRFPATQAVEV